ncbi:hypothetical protein [Pseudoxanthobacter sp.]|uniref:hypothetical protein n=1 Tax=Pseudoxanthobacter sp. TaxID=1925742 RepID=UPI002FE23518
MSDATRPAATAGRPTLGFGILSWHGYDSLRATLESYRAADLFSLADEVLLFLPEITPQGREIAREFGVPFAGSEKNLGILGGFKALAGNLSSERIVLLENDYRLVEDHATAARQLAAAGADIDDGSAHFVRLRHRRRPGQNWQGRKVAGLFPPDEASALVHLRALLHRKLRPDKASRLIGTTPYLFDDADRRWPETVSRSPRGTYLVSGAHLPWSNCPTLVPRAFYLSEIVAEAEKRVKGRLVNGFPTIETELNCPWWREHGFRIGIAADGLFSQIRLNDRGY